LSPCIELYKRVREENLVKSVPIRNFAGQAKLKGKKSKTLSCNCCTVVNFKNEIEEGRCKREIKDFKEKKEMSLPEQYSVMLTGFNSVAEAEAFLAWFSNQGEQDASEALENDDSLERPVCFIGMHYPTVVEGNVVRANIEIGYDED
jgi:hypothetical protein